MAEILDNITELVGQTPVLRLGRLSRAHDCRTPILAKLELLSPGGSMKDRAVLSILRGAMFSTPPPGVWGSPWPRCARRWACGAPW